MVAAQVFYMVIFIATLGIHAQLSEDDLKMLIEMPEVKKCLDSSGFKPDGNRQSVTPEKLCFFKCLLEETGTLDENGNLNPDTVDEAPFPIPKDKKDQIKQCLDRDDKIEKCEDVKVVLDCLHS